MTRRLLSAAALIACSLAVGCDAAPAASADASSIRLYALDCGRIEFKDMGMFADTGEYDGKSGMLVDPCFLIRHPRGVLLWDTGLGDHLAGKREGPSPGGITQSVDRSLQEQLQNLGLRTTDVTHLAFSHFHFDHTGNAHLFDQATWLLNRAELQAALGEPTPFGVDAQRIRAHAKVKSMLLDADHDVFGDGAVRILASPGHTVGHQVLLIKLQKSGAVLLSGDLYHTRENRRSRRVPGFNADRADTLASIDRIERILENTGARMIIQHDPEDFASLPRFPEYLD